MHVGFLLLKTATAFDISSEVILIYANILQLFLHTLSEPNQHYISCYKSLSRSQFFWRSFPDRTFIDFLSQTCAFNQLLKQPGLSIFPFSFTQAIPKQCAKSSPSLQNSAIALNMSANYAPRTFEQILSYFSPA